MGTSHEHGRQPVMKMKTVTTHYKIPGSATQFSNDQEIQ